MPGHPLSPRPHAPELAFVRKTRANKDVASGNLILIVLLCVQMVALSVNYRDTPHIDPTPAHIDCRHAHPLSTCLESVSLSSPPLSLSRGFDFSLWLLLFIFSAEFLAVSLLAKLIKILAWFPAGITSFFSLSILSVLLSTLRRFSLPPLRFHFSHKIALFPQADFESELLNGFLEWKFWASLVIIYICSYFV